MTEAKASQEAENAAMSVQLAEAGSQASSHQNLQVNASLVSLTTSAFKTGSIAKPLTTSEALHPFHP